MSAMKEHAANLGIDYAARTIAVPARVLDTWSGARVNLIRYPRPNVLGLTPRA